MLTATCQLCGRTGNNFYQIAHLVAYAKENGFDYFIPSESPHCPDGKLQFEVKNYTTAPLHTKVYNEPDHGRGPFWHEEPKFDYDVSFVGYWQTFLYFDKYRKEILELFNLPYNKVEMVSIHCRRGDYVTYAANFPPLPLEYYKRCILHFISKGHKNFLVFSDDIRWCKEHFYEFEGLGCKIYFSEGRNEIGDMVEMTNCEHNIVANSSFSFVGAWLNQNPDKEVLCPPSNKLFKGCNLDMVPNYYQQIEF